MNAADQKVVDAKIILMLFEPAYGIFASFMEWSSFDFSKLPGSSQTMGVRITSGGRIECLYQPEFVEKLTIQELASVIQHEIEHVVRFHCVRISNRNPTLWNIAADMAINGHRKTPKFGYVDENGVRHIPMMDKLIWLPDHFQDMSSAETIYNTLCNTDQRRLCKLQGNPGNLSAASTWDNHEIWKEQGVDIDEARETVAQITEKVFGLTQGNTPGSWAESIKNIGKSIIRWEYILKTRICQFLSGKQKSFNRQNRRNSGFGIPGMKKTNDIRINIVLDTSGSISQKMIEVFFGEIEKIPKNSKVDLLQWDTSFQGFNQYKKGDWKTMLVKGRGGTDMEAPFAWLEKNHKIANVNVIFTDGFCNWPVKKIYPVIPVICGDAPGPDWAKPIRISI